MTPAIDDDRDLATDEWLGELFTADRILRRYYVRRHDGLTLEIRTHEGCWPTACLNRLCLGEFRSRGEILRLAEGLRFILRDSTTD